MLPEAFFFSEALVFQLWMPKGAKPKMMLKDFSLFREAAGRYVFANVFPAKGIQCWASERHYIGSWCPLLHLKLLEATYKFIQG